MQRSSDSKTEPLLKWLGLCRWLSRRSCRTWRYSRHRSSWVWGFRASCFYCCNACSSTSRSHPPLSPASKNAETRSEDVRKPKVDQLVSEICGNRLPLNRVSRAWTKIQIKVQQEHKLFNKYTPWFLSTLTACELFGSWYLTYFSTNSIILLFWLSYGAEFNT
jgi:hypothetical protein